jgi:hypothetical protein
MRLVVFLICSVIGYTAGYFFPAGAWSNFVSILVSYHLFLIWLVFTAEHKTGFSLPIVPTILTHVACVAVVVTLGLGRNVVPFFGLIRLFIPALAPFECTWLFSADTAKVKEETKKEIPDSAEDKAAVDRATAKATGEDYEAWTQYLAHRDPRLRKPGMSVKEEYEQWMVARVKSRSGSS